MVDLTVCLRKDSGLRYFFQEEEEVKKNFYTKPGVHQDLSGHISNGENCIFVLSSIVVI